MTQRWTVHARDLELLLCTSGARPSGTLAASGLASNKLLLPHSDAILNPSALMKFCTVKRYCTLYGLVLGGREGSQAPATHTHNKVEEQEYAMRQAGLRSIGHESVLPSGHGLAIRRIVCAMFREMDRSERRSRCSRGDEAISNFVWHV